MSDYGLDYYRDEIIEAARHWRHMPSLGNRGVLEATVDDYEDHFGKGVPNETDHWF